MGDQSTENISAVARRMGMKQSLLAAYMRGLKKPSAKHEKEIMNTVRQIGLELVSHSQKL